MRHNAVNNCAQMPAALQILQFYCKAHYVAGNSAACARAMGI